MKGWRWSGLIMVITLSATAYSATKPTADTDVISPQLVNIGAMTTERAAHQTTLLTSGQLLVTGGCARRCDAILASAERYDPATRVFKPVAAMTMPRASHAAIALRDGRVLVVGGWTGTQATASAELYSPKNERFTALMDMTTPRISPVITPLADGRLLISGGESRVGVSLASAEIFDPKTSRFSAVSPMTVPRMSHAAQALPDGRVLLAGGHRARRDILRSAEIFDPANGTFKPTGDMAFGRHKLAAATLPGGKVMIIGGSDARDDRGLYRSTEIYDPATGKFTQGPTMLSARHKLLDSIVVLPTGLIVVAGGAQTPEIYDPVAGRFAAVQGKLKGPQMFATASVLPDGNILILGGYDEQIEASAQASLLQLSR